MLLAKYMGYKGGEGMDLNRRARRLLKEFKGDQYAFGRDTLDAVGSYARKYGKSVLVVSNKDSFAPFVQEIVEVLEKSGLELAGGRIFPAARPNAPREDVYRIESYILHHQPDCIVVVGGGSAIDAVKAANVLATLGAIEPEVDTYFGTGIVSKILQGSTKRLVPMIAVQTAASSGAHLTKYSNVTDPLLGQKKLIVDQTIVPHQAVFDYGVTAHMPPELTIDGALDGMAHCIEVFYGASENQFDRIREITEVALELIVANLGAAIKEPLNFEFREALGLATDLGAYAIMVGGTNGAHLTSFSLVDLTSHGRACGLMNPYYTVFFAPAIEKQLSVVGGIFAKHGLIKEQIPSLTGRKLGEAVAAGMIAFSKSVGAPTRLLDLPGFDDALIERALLAAKDPQLEMKLTNMPVSLDFQSVDDYMGPILWAAKTGDFGLIRNMEVNQKGGVG